MVLKHFGNFMLSKIISLNSEIKTPLYCQVRNLTLKMGPSVRAFAEAVADGV